MNGRTKARLASHIICNRSELMMLNGFFLWWLGTLEPSFKVKSMARLTNKATTIPRHFNAVNHWGLNDEIVDQGEPHFENSCYIGKSKKSSVRNWVLIPPNTSDSIWKKIPLHIKLKDDSLLISYEHIDRMVRYIMGCVHHLRGIRPIRRSQ